MKYMSTSSMSNFTGTVTCELPVNSGTYTIGNFRVEVSAVDNELNVVTTLVTPTAGTVVNPTSSVAGSVSIPNIPLNNSGGNSVKVRYLKSTTEIVTLGITGTYAKSYIMEQ
jgi:hypothetical protein